jgi:hypothetical protein
MIREVRVSDEAFRRGSEEGTGQGAGPRANAEGSELVPAGQSFIGQAPSTDASYQRYEPPEVVVRRCTLDV